MADVLDFTAHGPFEVHSPEWHAHRRRTIGASEIASILSAPGAYSTPLQVWAEKRGIFKEDEEEYDDSKKDWLHFGQALEPIIAAEFEKRAKKYAVVPEDRQFISVPYPFLGCSLDRWFLDPEIETVEMWPLDLKNTSIFMKDEWEGTVPLRYNVQIQGQMAVTGADQAALAVLIGGNQFKWALIERNQRFIDVMLEKLERFWEMVQSDVMPEPVAKDNEFMGQILGDEKPETTMVLSPGIVTVDAEVQRIKAEIKELKAEQSKLEAKIKKEIGTNERGVLPEGGQYTFKTVEREGYEVKSTTFRQLRRLKG